MNPDPDISTAPAPRLALDVMIESPDWAGAIEDLEGLTRDTAEACLRAAGIPAASLCVLFRLDSGRCRYSARRGRGNLSVAILRLDDDVMQWKSAPPPCLRRQTPLPPRAPGTQRAPESLQRPHNVRRLRLSTSPSASSAA